jgi:uncharacterized protein (TIGR03083 family)
MPLIPPPEADTRPLFRPVSTALSAVLRELSPDDWRRPTLAGSWQVRDLVAHLTDLAARRLSFDRDRHVPPAPPFPIRGPRDFVRFINRINHDWVMASERLSPRVLTDLFDEVALDLAEFLERRPLDGAGLFGVSWAGEDTSAAWLDIGREFTELWHHQMQIRIAVGAPPLEDSRCLDAALIVAVRALPFTYRGVSASPGDTVCIEVDGATPDAWTLERTEHGWMLWAGCPDVSAATVRLNADVFWRLLFNALRAEDEPLAASSNTRADLTTPLLRARAIVI